MISYIVESFEKKCKVLDAAKDDLIKAEKAKEIILTKLKEISSYKTLFDQYS